MQFFLSPTFAAISFAISILSVGFAIFTYFRTKKDLRWTYSVNSFNLVGGKHPLSEEFQLSYKGQKIDTVTISKVLLVNSGDVPMYAFY